MKKPVIARSVFRDVAIYVSLFLYGLFFVWPAQALATTYQTCNTSSTCSVGEFLYDDSYVPISSATCTLTSRYPDGTVFLNSVAMTAASDGWYSYSATIGTTTGLYRSQICCTTSPDYLCLDKTFEVKTAATSLTAADVWGYSGRTLSSYGNLISDIWSYSSRSMTSFGDLVSSIWSNSSRTVTNSTTVTEQTIINNIQQDIQEQRTLLEQIVNKPIVKTFIDDGSTPNLQTKLEKSKNLAASLYRENSELKNRAELLDQRWDDLTVEEIQGELTQIIKTIKEGEGGDVSGLINQTDWLKKSWNSTIGLNLSDQAQSALSKVESLSKDLSLFGKKNLPLSVTSIITHIDNLDTLIGTTLASVSDPSLYGYLRNVSEKAVALDKEAGKIGEILGKWDETPIRDAANNYSLSSNQVLALNLVPSPQSIIERSRGSDKLSIKNKFFGLLSLIDTNKYLLASNTGKFVQNIWLEEGSIIYRAVATNPSSTITQKVPIKIYLPPEIKKEQIIKFDPELKIDYDTTENTLFASGDVSLTPEQTKTFMVEVQDVWSYSDDEINIIKKQVDDLSKSLKGSSLYTQATGIKSDINVTLEKIILRQKQAITPENRIRTYRESRLEMVGVEEKINSLKLLVTQSNNNNNLLGFVSGVQAVAVWGLVIIIVAGFVFLASYIRALRQEIITKPIEASPSVALAKGGSLSKKPKTDTFVAIHHQHLSHRNRKAHKVTMLTVAALLSGSVSFLGLSVVVSKAKNGSVLLNPLTTTTKPQALGANTTSNSKKEEFPIEQTLIVPPETVVNLRSLPSMTSSIVATYKQNRPIYVFEKFENYARVGLTSSEPDQVMWVSQEFLR